MKRLLTVLFCSIFLYLPFRLVHAIVGNENNTAFAVPVEGITIDGDISDWPDTMIRWPILDDTNTRGDTDLDFEDLHTSSDYSCSFMVGYNLDENLLYVAVIARDDLEYATNIDSWNTDACELYLDATHRERRHIWAKLDAKYLSSTYYILCPPGGGYGFSIYTVNPRQPNFALIGGDVLKTNSRAAYGRRNSQTVYEFALNPLERYPDTSMKLAPGDTLGFDLAMVDKDTVSDNIAYITWGPFRGAKMFDADSCGDVVLIKSYDQLGRITGTVSNRQDGEPVQWATVRVSTDSDIPVSFEKTGDDGNFSFHLLPGRYRVWVEHGQDTQPLSVTVRAGKVSDHITFRPSTCLTGPMQSFVRAWSEENAWFPDIMAEVITVRDIPPEVILSIAQEAVQHPDPVRRVAALRLMEDYIPRLHHDTFFPLIHTALGDENPDVVWTAIILLKEIEKTTNIRYVETNEYLDALGKVIKAVGSGQLLISKSENQTRDEMSLIFGRIGAEAKPLVPDLISIACDTTLSYGSRRIALNFLEAIGPPAAQAVEALNALVTNEDEFPYTRVDAAHTLCFFGPGKRQNIDGIVSLLTKVGNHGNHITLCLGLAELGPAAHAAVDSLIELLSAEHEVSRGIAAATLGHMGYPAHRAIPELVELLNDQATWSAEERYGVDLGDWTSGKEHPSVHYHAAQGLNGILRSSLAHVDSLNNQDLKRLIDTFTEYEEALKEYNRTHENAIDLQAIDDLRAHYRARPVVDIMGFITSNNLHTKAWFWLVTVYLALTILCLASWFVLLAWKPYWLYVLNEKVRHPEITPEAVGITFGLRQILWLSPFNYHYRVLDAWVAHNFGKAREAFGNLQTVKERHYYVPLPINIDENCVERPEPDIFRPMFERDNFNLIVHGEGGSGKTSLACRLAHWAMGDNVELPLAGHSMIPVMIEHNLTTKLKEQKHPLLQAIHTQVELATENDDLRPELIQQLLKKRRILVIVDRFSEMNAETREIVQAGHTGDLKINALVVTSRLRENLHGARFTSIEPLRIDKDHLMPFMTAYLMKENLNDSVYFEACTKLSRIAGPRGITALLARLFAEQMRRLTEEATTIDDMPDTIVDLMIGYLNWLNRNRTENDMDNHTVQRIASVIAWKAIEKEFRPSDVSLKTVQNELAGEVNLENNLHYLDKKLGVIRYTGESMRRLRVSLDPLAEYLAALHLLDLYRDYEIQWSQFIESAQSKSTGGVTIAGFLIAVIDCIQAEGEEYGVPEFVVEKLQALIPSEEGEMEIAG